MFTAAASVLNRTQTAPVTRKTFWDMYKFAAEASLALPRLSSNGRTAMWIRFLETCKHALLLSSLISIPRFTISLCSKCHSFWKLFTCFCLLAGDRLLVYI